MRRAGFGQVAPGEVPTAAALLKAVGGARGLVESILPGLGFLVVYTLTHELVVSVLAPVVVAIAFVVLRLVGRTPATQAFAGVIGIGISAALALMTGRAEDNFVPGLIVNVVSGRGALSLAVRWPLIGVIAGLLTNEGDGVAPGPRQAARSVARDLALVRALHAPPRRAAAAVLREQPEGLAGTKLLMGVPLYAALLWVTWLLVRSVYRRVGPPATLAAVDERASGVSLS